MNSSKLGKCEVCAKENAKYCCPECEVKTCSFQCCNIHKKELNCSGIRSRVKFKSVKSFSDMDLLSDYRLLEEVGRSVEKYSSDKRTHNYSFYELPIGLFRLRGAAIKRNIELQFLPKEFRRRKANTTFLNYKTQELSWRIEWVFAQANDTKYVDEKVIDTELIGKILDKYINSSNNKDKSLRYYHAAGHSGIMMLLKAEKVPGKRFFELDPLASLCDNLSGKVIIEFPVIYVIMKEHKQCYDIVEPDEEEEILKQWKSDREQKPIHRQNMGKRKHHNGQSIAERNSDFKKNFFINNDDSDVDSDDSTKDDSSLAKKFNKALKTEDESVKTVSYKNNSYYNRHISNSVGESSTYYNENNTEIDNCNSGRTLSIPYYDELVSNH